jgi:hypothetical protein
MKKGRLTLARLIAKNKEELLNDKTQVEKIEKRLDEKYTKWRGK